MFISNYMGQQFSSKTGLPATKELIGNMVFAYANKFKAHFRYNHGNNTTVETAKQFTPKMKKQADIVVDLFVKEYNETPKNFEKYFR